MTKVSIPQLLHTQVAIRRSGRVVRNVLTQALISDIKRGRFEKDDEISADEKNWVRLDQHCQLAGYFPTEHSSIPENLSPDIGKRLTELSKMLKDLNR